jgi:hypothetical protein
MTPESGAARATLVVAKNDAGLDLMREFVCRISDKVRPVFSN